MCLCCHSNETRAPIANPPNSGQLKGTPYYTPKLHLGPFVWECSEEQTHTDDRDQFTFRLGYMLVKSTIPSEECWCGVHLPYLGLEPIGG